MSTNLYRGIRLIQTLVYKNTEKLKGSLGNFWISMSHNIQQLKKMKKGNRGNKKEARKERIGICKSNMKI